MKKLSKKQRQYLIIISRIRFKVKLKSKSKADPKIRFKSLKKKKQKRDEYLVQAPTILDISKPNNHTKMTQFKHDIELACSYASNDKKPVRICFRSTTSIVSGACILLIATIDKIINDYPTVRFRVTRPSAIRLTKGRKINLVDGVLCHIGFYKLIGHSEIKVISKERNVTCWNYTYNDSADGEIASHIITSFASFGFNTTKVYRSCMEAIANAAEHAYTDKIVPDKAFTIKRWWLLLGITDDYITLVICDLGHGIPNTLEITQEKSLLDKIWGLLKLKGKPSQDSLCIKGATMIKETRTLQDNRGKGGKDIKTFIDATPNSRLSIFSNKGVFIYRGSKEEDRNIAHDTQNSIGGTILQWSVPIPKGKN